MVTSNREILIDADVVSHFVTAGKAGILKQIFPGNTIRMLDKVHKELQDWPNDNMRAAVSELLSKKQVKLMDFPEDNITILMEYAWIKTALMKGDGESACLAVARHNKHILASSNLRDIKTYCNTHNIDYLTTMDFLCEAVRRAIFTETDANAFIQTVKKARGKLPVNTMAEYSCREIPFL
ncbi:MAG: hypothetical protein EOO45_22000 [Flavobacterium sp.]|nr:MAG: hypothetical protein EOO45_22000 [Flavobacterium sp.]